MNRLPFLVVLLAVGCSAQTPVGSSPIPEPSESPKRLTEGVATALRFTWTVNGKTVRLPQVNGTVELPLDTTGLLTVQGRDASGAVVPLEAPVWTGSGLWFTVDGDGLQATVTPISEGPYDPAFLNADADPGPGVVPISGFVQIKVIN